MNEPHLRDHVRRMHADLPPKSRQPYQSTGDYACVNCGSRYATPDELHRHRLALHPRVVLEP